MPSILIEESSMEIVFILDLDFLNVLKEPLINDWQKISRILSRALKDSFLRNFKTLFIHVSEDPHSWKYLTSDEQYSNQPIQPTSSFLALFATRERAYV